MWQQKINTHTHRLAPLVRYDVGRVRYDVWKGAIRCTEGCDTMYGRVRYECLGLDTSAIQESCHDVLFIIKLQYCRLASGVSISTQYEIQNFFNKTVFGWCNFNNTTFTLDKISKILKRFTKFYTGYIRH